MLSSVNIIGKVEYRQGDGVNIAIRPGPCEVELSPADATLSWTDGESRGSASIPIAVYKRYVAKKAIVVNDATAA
jgi:hypothetical protein